jgi:hypothetical protein
MREVRSSRGFWKGDVEDTDLSKKWEKEADVGIVMKNERAGGRARRGR